MSLFDRDALQRVNRGEPFSRTLIVEAASPQTGLDVKLDGLGDTQHSISGFPYKLADIIHDQGLECSFGWRSHVQALAASRATSGHKSEVSGLIELLHSY